MINKDGLGIDYRTTLRLCVVAVLGLSPFAVHHVLIGRWPMAVAMALLITILVSCGVYLWLSRRVHPVNRVMAAAGSLVTLWAVFQMPTTAIHWVAAMLLANFYILPHRWGVAANVVLVPTAIALAAPHLPAEEVYRVIGGLACAGMFAYLFSRSVHKQQAQLSRLATVDPLTGAANRRALDDALEAARQLFRRHWVPMSVIAIDIDHFKSVNDRFGHDVGDAALVDLAQRIRQRIRRTDQLYRSGGEEFLVLTTHTELDAAYRLAEDLRVSLAAAAPTAPMTEAVTISAGVAQLQPNESVAGWLKRADQALYQAKQGGRNQVVAITSMDALARESA